MTIDEFKDHITPDFTNPDINDYTGSKELPPPKVMIEEIPEIYRTYIDKNFSEPNLNWQQSYCQLMTIAFPNLNIVQGMMLFDRGDIRNKWGKFIYCTDQNGTPINPLFRAFDRIYDYKTLRTIVKAPTPTDF